MKISEKIKRKKRGLKSGEHYFTQVHQDAIVKYNNSVSEIERNKIYKEILDPVFDEMINKIVLTFKFYNLENLDILKKDCKSYVVTVLSNFKPEKNYKAFGYFSVIIKNWFIQKINKQQEELNRSLSHEEVYKNLEGEKTKKSLVPDELIIHNNHLEELEFFQFFQKMMLELEKWDNTKILPQEKKVLNAIIEIFEKRNDLENLNKKSIYCYLRTLTGMTTKQIVDNINKFKIKYRTFKKRWDDGDF